MVSLQMAPQIRMIQSSDAMMAEKIQSTLVNTIPLWKSQMIIALGVEHSRQAAEAQREVSGLYQCSAQKECGEAEDSYCGDSEGERERHCGYGDPYCY